MSKHETWRTRQYWQSVGGLLIEEFLAIPLDRENGIGKRLIDGVIVLGEIPSIQKGGRHDFTGKDIIVVQTKSGRLGMYLMGQASFLLKRDHEALQPQIDQNCGAMWCGRFGDGNALQKTRY